MVRRTNDTASDSTELVPVDAPEALPVVWRASEPMEAEPDWMVARPPYNPESAIDKLWSDIMVWPRRGMRLFMWLTLYWWRSAMAVGTLLLIWLVVTHG